MYSANTVKGRAKKNSQDGFAVLKVYFYLYVCVSMGTLRGQKRPLDPLDWGYRQLGTPDLASEN